MTEDPRTNVGLRTFLGGVLLGALVGGLVATLLGRGSEVARGSTQREPAAPTPERRERPEPETAPWDELLLELSAIRQALSRSGGAAPPATTSTRAPLEPGLEPELLDRLADLTRAVERLASTGPISRPGPDIAVLAGPKPELDRLMARLEGLQLDWENGGEERFGEVLRQELLLLSYEDVLALLGRPQEVHVSGETVYWWYARPDPSEAGEELGFHVVFHDGLVVRFDT